MFRNLSRVSLGQAFKAQVRVSRPQELRSADDALLNLLSRLRAVDYAFISPTPATHGLVRRRRPASAEDILRDVLGWGRAFDRGMAPPWLMQALSDADALNSGEAGCTSKLRVSTLDGRLHLHSASSRQEDAVFLGPDSYRYVRFLRQSLAGIPFDRALEIGVGAGAGALALAALRPAAQIAATDINPLALRLAGLNALHSGLALELLAATLPSDGRRFDLIIANPPYMAGRQGRLYRDGGGRYGAETALDWAAAALPRLEPGGRFLLYTGAPVVAGVDVVRESLDALTTGHGATLTYDEIDPDVFGGSLGSSAYSDVERIAAVGAVVTVA